HVLVGDRRWPGDGQLKWPAFLGWIELDHPFAIRAGRGLFGLPGDGERDRLIGCGRPPDRGGEVALEHHVVGENRRQMQRRRRVSRAERRLDEEYREDENGQAQKHAAGHWGSPLKWFATAMILPAR